MSQELREKARKMSTPRHASESSLRRMSVDKMGELYARNLRAITEAKAAIEEIEAEMECRFPCAKKEETLPTTAGVFKRVVETKWIVNADRIDDIRGLFGPEFGTLIEDKTTYGIAQDRVPDLRKTLKTRFGDLIIVTPKWGCSRSLSAQLAKSEEKRIELEGMISANTLPPRISFKPTAQEE